MFKIFGQVLDFFYCDVSDLTNRNHISRKIVENLDGNGTTSKPLFDLVQKLQKMNEEEIGNQRRRNLFVNSVATSTNINVV